MKAAEEQPATCAITLAAIFLSASTGRRPRGALVEVLLGPRPLFCSMRGHMICQL